MKPDRIRHEIEQEFYPDGQMKRHHEIKEPIINDFLINFIGGILAIVIVGTCFVIIFQIKNHEQHDGVVKSSYKIIERSRLLV